MATDKSRRFRDFSCPSRARHFEIRPFERVVVHYGTRVTTPLRLLVTRATSRRANRAIVTLPAFTLKSLSALSVGWSLGDHAENGYRNVYQARVIRVESLQSPN